MNKLDFNNSPFEQSHLRSPRGRGSWAFCPDEYADENDYITHTKFSPSMTFMEAKRWAKVQRWPQGTETLAVLP